MEDMRGQSGQESVSRDKAVPRAAKDPDMEAGMTVRSTAREHDKQGRNKEGIMGSPTDRRTSAYSKDHNNTREEPTEGTHGAERVGIPRCSG